MADRRIDLNELRERVRRRGLLGAFTERPSAAPEPAQAPPPPLEWRVEEDPPPPPPAAAEPDERDTVEFVLDPQVAEKLRGCRLSCAAVISALADLPAIEAGGQVLEVALVRMTVRRPEGDAECCVRQAIPPEVRGVVGPGAGVMVLAHEHDRSVAAIDWTATGEWVGAKLTFPTAHQQYDWPPRSEWPARGRIEVYDLNGQAEELYERRGKWSLATAALVSLTPLRTRVGQRDEWQIVLQLADGRTVELRDRVPLLALARLRPGNDSRVGTPIDVMVSVEGEVAVDWESTLRQPELRTTRF